MKILVNANHSSVISQFTDLKKSESEETFANNI